MLRSIVEIEPRVKQREPQIIYPIFNLETPVFNKPNDDYIGKIFPSNRYGDFIVLKWDFSKISKWKTTLNYYTIQFLKTGFKQSQILSSRIKVKNLKDKYFPLVNNGFIGNFPFELKGIYLKLYITWKNMLKRCYRQNNPSYNQTYINNNVFVSNRWHDFSIFVEDVQKLKNWDKKQQNWSIYELDKDYYNSNCYSLDTCVWLPQQDNKIYQTKCIPIRCETLDGKIYTSLNLTTLIDFLHLPYGTCYDMLHKTKKIIKKPVRNLEFCKVNPNLIYRYEL